MGSSELGCTDWGRRIFRTVFYLIPSGSRLKVLQIMPLITPLAYLFLLPSSESFVFSDVSPQFIRSLPYTPLAAAVDEEGEEEGAFSYGPRKNVSLSLSDKWKIVRPLLPKYMLPLCKSMFTPDDRSTNTHHVNSVCVYTVCEVMATALFLQLTWNSSSILSIRYVIL